MTPSPEAIREAVEKLKGLLIRTADTCKARETLVDVLSLLDEKLQKQE